MYKEKYTKEFQLVTKTENLLFDILIELEKMNSSKKPVKQPIKKGKVCEYCGKVHDRGIDYALCAKKHKKEGIKK